MLTSKQQLFVDYYITCRNGAEAARRAGYSERTARQIATENLSKPDIKAALALKESEAARKVELDRAAVIGELLQANKIARENTDAANMIRAWLAIAKILGLDQPEVKPVAHGAEHDSLRGKLELMSDEELIRLATGTV